MNQSEYLLFLRFWWKQSEHKFLLFQNFVWKLLTCHPWKAPAGHPFENFLEAPLLKKKSSGKVNNLSTYYYAYTIAYILIFHSPFAV